MKMVKNDFWKVQKVDFVLKKASLRSYTKNNVTGEKTSVRIDVIFNIKSILAL